MTDEGDKRVTAEKRAQNLMSRTAASHWGWSKLQDEIIKEIKQAESFARSEGRVEGFAEAAKIAESTNLNVHPECGISIAFCIRALRTTEKENT